MFLLPFERRLYRVALPPAEVIAQLRSELDRPFTRGKRRRFIGFVGENRFHVRRRVTFTEVGWLPQVFGVVEANSNGTLIKVLIRPHMAFLLVWGIMITVMIFWGIFYPLFAADSNFEFSFIFISLAVAGYFMLLLPFRLVDLGSIARILNELFAEAFGHGAVEQIEQSEKTAIS